MRNEVRSTFIHRAGWLIKPVAFLANKPMYTYLSPTQKPWELCDAKLTVPPYDLVAGCGVASPLPHLCAREDEVLIFIDIFPRSSRSGIPAATPSRMARVGYHKPILKLPRLKLFLRGSAAITALQVGRDFLTSWCQLPYACGQSTLHWGWWILVAWLRHGCGVE